MLQTILDASVRQRHFVLLLAICVAIAGLFAARALPIDAVPDITNNQVQINTTSAALSPVEIEKQVTFPIETALAGIHGLEYTRSLSRNGFSQVTAVFADDVDVYFARTQISERLTAAREQLPPGVEPKLGATATGLGEIYMWTVEFAPRNPQRVQRATGWQDDGSFLTPDGERLASELERAAYLRTVQDWIVRPQMRSVPGVAGVDSIGGFVKQYHVSPDVMSLVSYGLTFGDVIEALEVNNVSTGAGFVDHGGETYLVRASGRIEHPREIENIVVGSRAGVPIRIADVATVGIGREARTGSASVNGAEAVVGTALMTIGQNSRTVAAAADARLQQLQSSLPPDVRVRAVLDRTKLVDATIATVTKNLVEGAILVVAVLLLLLGSLRAALVCALAIPLSVAMTSLGMLEAGVSGNLMSLGAIDFGLIVDGSVIIVENCLRRLGERQHALGRALVLAERLAVVSSAAREMVRPSVYGQAIIVTVYVPVLTLTGVEGKLFQPMALTVIFALASAFVLSLTVVPALVALVMTGKVRERENAVVRGARSVYEPLLRHALRARAAWIVAAFAAFAGAVALGTRLGQEFVPVLDEQDLALHAIRMPSTSLDSSSMLQHEVERALAAFPEVETVFSKTGTAEMASDPMPPNVSDTFVILAPREAWPDPKESKAALVARLDRALAAVPGSNYEWTQPIQMRFNELIAGVRSDVAVKVFGDEFDALSPVAARVEEVLRSVRGSADVKVEQTTGLPVLSIDVDREALGRHGLAVAEVHDVVAAAIGGRGAGIVFEGDTRVELIVRLPETVRQDLAALRELPIPLPRDDDAHVTDETLLASDGAALHAGFVPLSAVARVSLADGLAQVSRENGKRRIVVQCNVRGRDLGSFVAEARARVAEIALPPGSWIAWGGQFENLVSARVRLAWVVPACFLIVWLLLYGTFRSARDAWIVFSGVPLGVTGGVLALWGRDLPLSISAAVGFIALSGVAVLNGVVLLSAIRALRREGADLESAIVTGATTRLRPVLMTALVASLGFVPMALATGTGAEVQRPLATVVIGGLVSSTLLTLLVLPALYRAFARKMEDTAETDAVQPDAA